MGTPKHTEAYEALAETRGGVPDLKPILQQMREPWRAYLRRETPRSPKSLLPKSRGIRADTALWTAVGYCSIPHGR